MKKILLFILFPLSAAASVLAQAPQDSTASGKKHSNLLSIGIQPNLFRLNLYDPNFFNNTRYKPGLDITFLYGKTFGRHFIGRTGLDIVFNQGKFFIGKDKDEKYFNETFLRVPGIIVKRFPIECSTCILNPVFFIEGGGYASLSLFQSTYIKDAPTGLSSLDKSYNASYMKSGLTAGIGISFLSNNFGRHVVGLRIFSDQWLIRDYKSPDFRPSYTSMAVYYNIANLSW